MKNSWTNIFDMVTMFDKHDTAPPSLSEPLPQEWTFVPGEGQAAVRNFQDAYA